VSQRQMGREPKKRNEESMPVVRGKMAVKVVEDAQWLVGHVGRLQRSSVS